MDASSKKARFFLLLAGVLLVTLTVVSFLVMKTRPTVVEMTLSARRAAFEVLPPAGADEGDFDGVPAALRRVSLFAPGLEIRALEVRDASCVEATLDATGPVALLPETGGSVGIRMAEPFRPELVLNEPTRVSLDVSGRNKISLELAPQGPPLEGSGWPEPLPAAASAACPELPAGRGWDSLLPVGPEMSLRLQNVRAAGLAGLDDHPVPADAARFRIVSGRRESQLSLALPPAPGPSTAMRVLDPASGEVSEPQSLPLALTEPRSILWHDRLVLLDPVPAGDRSVALLRPDLEVGSLELARQVKLEDESFVLGGKVRFPAGEKEAFELEPGAFVALAVDPRRPFRLRSIELDGGKLNLVLWGEPTSLRVGLTPRLRSERLPNYFEWLYTHRLAGLVYATLAYVAAISVTVFKILGWAQD